MRPKDDQKGNVEKRNASQVSTNIFVNKPTNIICNLYMSYS